MDLSYTLVEIQTVYSRQVYVPEILFFPNQKRNREDYINLALLHIQYFHPHLRI